MSYPAISLTTPTVGRHRRPQKRLQTVANPPSTRIRARTIRVCYFLSPFQCPLPVHPCPSVDSGLNPWGTKDHPFLTAPDGTITLTSSEPTNEDFYEYLDAHHNGNVTSIYVYHNTVDDKVITLTDPSTTTKGWSWWIGDCFYGMRHDGAYKEAFHHASASVLTKDQETLDTVYKEARKLGYEPTLVWQYESGATYTHLQPPRNQCIPLEEAYRLAKEINKIPGVQRLEWLTAESGRLKEYRSRLASRNKE